ncbi:MAG: hypothetical protein HY064_15055 [Bacteroidetes bacterium]|nr:hypothetical protein [Bacteroidota bacterium]
MRYLFFLFLIFHSSCAFHTKLAGDYYESFGAMGGGANYHFSKNGMFTYSSHYDVGGEVGSGTYKVRLHSIIFNFSAYDQKKDSSSITVSKNDSINVNYWEVEVTVSDTSKYPMIGAMIIYSDSMGNKLGGKSCDLDGKARIHVADYLGALNIEIKMTGYNSCTLKLRQRGHYRVNVSMKESGYFTVVADGTKWKYHLNYFSRDEIKCVRFVPCGECAKKNYRKKIVLEKK